MRNDEPDSVDRALDKALAQYSNLEPLAGLEQRVLNRVRAEGSPRRFRCARWALAAGVSVAAGLVVAIAVWWMRPIPLAPVLVQASRPVPLATPVRATPARVRKTGKAGRPVPLPKRRVFPTPAPVSREERALLAFARLAPDVLREAFAGKQAPPVEAIRIEEIKIEPLQSDGLR